MRFYKHCKCYRYCVFVISAVLESDGTPTSHIFNITKFSKIINTTKIAKTTGTMNYINNNYAIDIINALNILLDTCIISIEHSGGCLLFFSQTRSGAVNLLLLRIVLILN